MTPDALPKSWIYRTPRGLQPYLRLARFDRPIGTWLLYWPCVWGLLLAPPSLGWMQFKFALLLAVGSVAMRSAGCVWNDILDRDLDAQVARTQLRPLPAGEIKLAHACLFLCLLCLIGLAVLLLLPWRAQIVALCAIPLVGLYPLMKRITWWPQLWLGFTFNWGALVGYVAVAGQLDSSVLLLYAGAVFWTLGYDTIYALQDLEDDALVGIQSTARRFGRWVVGAIAIFYTSAVVFAGLAQVQALAVPAAVAVAGFGAQLGWQILKLRQAAPVIPAALALQLFRSNAMAATLLAAGMAVFRAFLS
jgi:4-hydroxybenzoate polyprenyltransferase